MVVKFNLNATQVWLRVLLWMWGAVGGVSFLVRRSVRSVNVGVRSEAALQLYI
jgi:hypothetical protein